MLSPFGKIHPLDILQNKIDGKTHIFQSSLEKQERGIPPMVKPVLVTTEMFPGFGELELLLPVSLGYEITGNLLDRTQAANKKKNSYRGLIPYFVQNPKKKTKLCIHLQYIHLKKVKESFYS